MDESADAFWNNITTAHSQTHVTTVFLVFNCVVLTLTFLLGLPGNLLVCWVVYRTRSLQTANNALLVNLAASDLLKCSLDTPLLLVSIILRCEVSASLCALQQFTYALCSCVQLLTLVGISVERFQAIAFPFRTERRKARIRVWILSIWACGLILAVVSLTLSKRAHSYMLCRRRRHRDWDYYSVEQPDYYIIDPFGTYVLVPMWGCSLTLIVVHYVRIFKVVRQHRQKVFDSGIQLRPTAARHVWSWLGLTAGSAPRTAPPPGLRSLGLTAGSAPRTAPPAGLRSLGLTAGSAPRTAPPAGLRSLGLNSSYQQQRPRCTVITVAEANSSRAASSPESVPRCRPPEIVGAVCLLTPCALERGKKRMEGKLAQRFGYIIIAFTLFWMPMVVMTLLINIVSGHGADAFLMELETSAMVLTWVPAAVDPIIYSLLTRQFRSEFRKMLSSIHGCPLSLRGEHRPGLTT